MICYASTGKKIIFQTNLASKLIKNKIFFYVKYSILMQFINASSRLFDGKDKNVIPEEEYFKMKLI